MQLDLIPVFIGGLRGWQLILIVLLAIMLFGTNRIPQMMRNLGKGVHSFKQGLAEAQEEINKPVDKAPAKTDTAAKSDAAQPKTDGAQANVESTAQAKDIDR